MIMPISKNEIDIKQFAEQVERLCDFFLDRVDKDGSDDVQVVQKLKEQAAEIIFDRVHIKVDMLEGLADYMKGSS